VSISKVLSVFAQKVGERGVKTALAAAVPRFGRIEK